jgi:hypothetical protein
MTVNILILGESLGQKKSIETTTLLDTELTWISTGRNAHLLGKQNRTKENLFPNQQSKMRLIQKIGKIILSI